MLHPTRPWSNLLHLRPQSPRVNPEVGEETEIKTDDAIGKWFSVRNKILGVGTADGAYPVKLTNGAIASLEVSRNTTRVFSYANCNASSFLTAVHTLDTMSGDFGRSSPQLKQWVHGHDQVFWNCSGPGPYWASQPYSWFEGVGVWVRARHRVPGLSTPSSFSPNCDGEKFRSTASDLVSMIGKLGTSDPQVKQWVEAQDQALNECSYRSGPYPAVAPEIPPALKDGTPFEQAQRTYQIACATFYSGDFDQAAKLFDAIAADGSSPWQQLAPYLAARALIRKATLSSDKNDPAVLTQAETRLNNIIAAPGDDGVKRAAQQLLGFVEAQLRPQHREQELAAAVMRPSNGPIFIQNVSDYIWLLNHRPATDNSNDSNELTDWIATFSAEDLAHSIERWKSSSSLPWLVAAIAQVPASDPNVPVLIEAAAKVKPESPTFTTVSYHLARLLIEQREN
jgi:hypothetical protein